MLGSRAKHWRISTRSELPLSTSGASTKALGGHGRDARANLRRRHALSPRGWLTRAHLGDRLAHVTVGINLHVGRRAAPGPRRVRGRRRVPKIAGMAPPLDLVGGWQPGRRGRRAQARAKCHAGGHPDGQLGVRKRVAHGRDAVGTASTAIADLNPVDALVRAKQVANPTPPQSWRRCPVEGPFATWIFRRAGRAGQPSRRRLTPAKIRAPVPRALAFRRLVAGGGARGGIDLESGRPAEARPAVRRQLRSSGPLARLLPGGARRLDGER